jgi:glycosyltransferase 2 family protein
MPWRRIGVAVSVCIIAISLSILWRRLHHLDVARVTAALRAKPWHEIAAAAAAIAASYVTLTFYDWFALRTIGARHVPYRIAALASFTSYSIGHNIGATVFTGGAIRYRIYSFRGLRVLDIAKLCFVTGLTFWLGNLTVLGLGMVYVPEAASAVDHLPALTNRLIGVAALFALVGYVAYVWRKPRAFGTDRWQVTLPDGPLTMLQLLIGLADLFFCALAISFLIPSQPPIPFAALSVVFVFATLFGFASHAPGSLGVFDAAMLVGLGQFDREELVAGLLLFRLLYFMLPFCLALLALGAREVLLAVERTPGCAPRARAIDNVIVGTSRHTES